MSVTMKNDSQVDFVLSILNNWSWPAPLTFSNLKSAGVIEEPERGAFEVAGVRLVRDWDYDQNQKGLYGWQWKREEDTDVGP